MFIKPISKHNKTTNEYYWIYRLCESYRIDGSIRLYTIINLGKLEQLETSERKKLLAKRIEELIKNGGNVLPLETTLLHGYKQTKGEKKSVSLYKLTL